MRKFIFLAVILFVCSTAHAEMRHTFYNQYSPSTAHNVWVYDSSSSTTTGDVADVFTYDKKSVFFLVPTIGTSYFYYQIEGRPEGEKDAWCILDTGEFGGASPDVSKNIVVDVTELVDHLRVGLRNAVDGADHITIKGIFRKGN